MGPPVDQGYRNKSELTLARPPLEGRIHSLPLMAISFVSAGERRPALTSRTLRVSLGASKPLLSSQSCLKLVI